MVPEESKKPEVDTDAPNVQISESFEYEEMDHPKKKGKMKWMMQSVIDLGTKS